MSAGTLGVPGSSSCRVTDCHLMGLDVLDEQFRAVFRRTANPMLLANDERWYVDGNAAVLKLLRVSAEQLRRMRIDDLTADELRSRVPEMWREFLARGAMTGSYRIQCPDGRQVDVEFSATANVAPGLHLSIFLLTDVDEPILADEALPVATSGLSSREREVLSLAANGATSREIADRLVVAHETARTHMRNAMVKLGAKTRAQAIAIALSRGDIRAQ
ncbi:MAG TPA: LuxR C-terminal-related transcriptional regulator [Solirubrobacteraceae bacterium]|nr:LuxR C-terminal-related transcriptional regulator [Solirubrobacteraceae bacterium]